MAPRIAGARVVQTLPSSLEESPLHTRAWLPSLYVSLAGKASVHLAQLGGSVAWLHGWAPPRGGPVIDTRI